MLYRVRVYAAINLPLVDEEAPSPFVLLKTLEQQERGQCARSVTGVVRSTRNAVWRSELAVAVERAALERERLFVALVDQPTKRYLFKCQLPARRIQPNRYYHYGLVFNTEGAYALMTVCREPSAADERALYEDNPNLLKATFTGMRMVYPPTTTTTTTGKGSAREALGLFVAAQQCDDLKAYLRSVKETMANPMHPNARRTPFKTVYHTNSVFQPVDK